MVASRKERLEHDREGVRCPNSVRCTDWGCNRYGTRTTYLAADVLVPSHDTSHYISDWFLLPYATLKEIGSISSGYH